MRDVLTCLLAVTVVTTAYGAEVREIHGPTMGTTYSIKWVEAGEKSISSEDLQKRVDECLARINSMMSTYDPESELSRFNRSTSTDWFEVSQETATVAQRALEIARLSNGAFDPTVGRLVGMWSFGADRRSYEPPPEDQIAKALQSVGVLKFIEVRLEPPAIRKSTPQVQLDFSAIAKGYGVDAVTEVLLEEGLGEVLVEIGGEVRAVGTKNGKPWTLGIERPAELLTRNVAATVALRDQALATSGDYRNFFEKDGLRYSHTINPQTGYPVTHQLASVSVVASDCMSADALATTLMVLGPEQGLEFANEHQVAAYLLAHDGTGYRQLISAAGEPLFRAIPDQAQEGGAGGLFSTFLITALVFGTAIAGLAVGVIFSNRRLKGSCGGLSAMKDEQGRSICEMCTTPPEECERFREKLVQSCPNEKQE